MSDHFRPWRNRKSKHKKPERRSKHKFHILKRQVETPPPPEPFELPLDSQPDP